MRNKTLVALVAMFVAGVAACGGSSGSSSSGSGDSSSNSGATTVMAPAAFKAPLDQLIAAFKTANPDAKVVVTPQDNAGALSAAATGGKAAVVITNSAGLSAPKGASTGSFGRNLAVIAVPKANPKNVKDVSVFKPGSGAKTIVCGTKSSLGDFSQLVLSKSNVTPAPATVNTAANCASTAAAQAAAGTVDAALFFRNGVKVPSGVKLIQIPTAQNAVFNFAYVAKDDANAKAFAQFIGSAQGQQILTENGYLP